MGLHCPIRPALKARMFSQCELSHSTNYHYCTFVNCYPPNYLKSKFLNCTITSLHDYKPSISKDLLIHKMCLTRLPLTLLAEKNNPPCTDIPTHSGWHVAFKLTNNNNIINNNSTMPAWKQGI